MNKNSMNKNRMNKNRMKKNRMNKNRMKKNGMKNYLKFRLDQQYSTNILFSNKYIMIMRI